MEALLNSVYFSIHKGYLELFSVLLLVGSQESNRNSICWMSPKLWEFPQKLLSRRTNQCFRGPDITFHWHAFPTTPALGSSSEGRNTSGGLADVLAAHLSSLSSYICPHLLALWSPSGILWGPALQPALLGGVDMGFYTSQHCHNPTSQVLSSSFLWTRKPRLKRKVSEPGSLWQLSSMNSWNSEVHEQKDLERTWFT